jgi:hypothetical protein
MLPVSLDCLWFFPSYCVPYVASFFGLCCGFFRRIEKNKDNPEKLAT